jgi:hypothetical protein
MVIAGRKYKTTNADLMAMKDETREGIIRFVVLKYDFKGIIDSS